MSFLIPDEVDRSDHKAARRAAMDCVNAAGYLIEIARAGPRGVGVSWREPTGTDGTDSLSFSVHIDASGSSAPCELPLPEATNDTVPILRGTDALERAMSFWLRTLDSVLMVAGYYDYCSTMGSTRMGLSARLVEFTKRVRTEAQHVVTGFHDLASRPVLFRRLAAFKRESTTLQVRRLAERTLLGWDKELPDPDEDLALSPAARMNKALAIAREAIEIVEGNEINFWRFYDWGTEVKELWKLWHRLFGLAPPPPLPAKCESYSDASAYLDEMLRELKTIAQEAAPSAQGAGEQSCASRTNGGDSARTQELPPELLAAPLSASELAERLNPPQPVPRVESFLRRYREEHPDCFITIDRDDRRRNEPRYRYRAGEVWTALQEQMTKWRQLDAK